MNISPWLAAVCKRVNVTFDRILINILIIVNMLVFIYTDCLKSK